MKKGLAERVVEARKGVLPVVRNPWQLDCVPGGSSGICGVVSEPPSPPPLLPPTVWVVEMLTTLSISCADRPATEAGPAAA